MEYDKSGEPNFAHSVELEQFCFNAINRMNVLSDKKIEEKDYRGRREVLTVKALYVKEKIPQYIQQFEENGGHIALDFKETVMRAGEFVLEGLQNHKWDQIDSVMRVTTENNDDD